MLSFSQIITNIRNNITDALMRQNTAKRLRVVLENFAASYFNKQSDSLAINQVIGLQDALDNRQAGAGGALVNPIIASLVDGKLGGIRTGDPFPAGTALEIVLNKLLVESIYPAYAVATIQARQSAVAVGEVGEVANNHIEAVFGQHDAGPYTRLVLLQNDVLLPGGADVVVSSMKRVLGKIKLQAAVDYGAGPLKLVPPKNDPDDRTPQIRHTDAPQDAENNFLSEPIYFEGQLRIFWGICPNGIPTNSDAVRALPNNQLTGQGLSGLLVTGNTAKEFVIVGPPNHHLASVLDLGNFRQELVGSYVAEPPIPVKDAGGVLVQGFRRYYLGQNLPYPNSTTHQFFFLPD